jgi:hypothetical protein
LSSIDWQAFTEWLCLPLANGGGILKLCEKTGFATFSTSEALVEALCHGRFTAVWI